MNKIKSLRTIKIILPAIFAVALLFVVFISSAFQGNTNSNELSTVDQLWELSAPNKDVTDPESYIPFIGVNPECHGVGQICVIAAPSTGGTTPRPDISTVTGLASDLQSFQLDGQPHNSSRAVSYKQ